MPTGRPYEDTSPSACQFVTDETRFAVRMCGEPTAWRGCGWCWEHLEQVAHHNAFTRLRDRLGARAAA